MLKPYSVMISSEKPEILRDFYQMVFKRDVDWSDGGYYGFNEGGMGLVIGPHDKVKGKNEQPARMMINFSTEDVEGEFMRIERFAPKVIAKPYTMDGESKMMIATLEDPDGNYFQLMTPM